MFDKMTRKLFLLVFIIFFLTFMGFSAFRIWTFGDHNQLVKSDAAIVLGAAVWDNQPSPVLRERINHSIWLYENDYIEKIIFTGGKSDENSLAESEVSKIYAIKHGVKSEDILIETTSKITEENFKYAYEIAKHNNLNSFIIVSDPLHMRRALTMAKDLGMKAYSSPTQTSAYRTLKTKIPFFLRELFFYIGYILSLPFR